MKLIVFASSESRPTPVLGRAAGRCRHPLSCMAALDVGTLEIGVGLQAAPDDSLEEQRAAAD